jgi:two-component system response regulator HydG
MIKEIKAIRPYIPIIIITGYSDVKVAVKAMKHGASEYVTKPIHPEEILINIREALKGNPESKVSIPAADVKPPAGTSASSQHHYVKGESQRSRHIEKLISLVAPTDMTVVLLGESGTGKEVVAREIHALSQRKGKPFVAVDCGALPQELAGSELFGHKKGAFTGAIADKQGHFELAHGGTLFLDEIGNLSYENQIKLLRVLQERKVRRLGDTKDVEVDIRIIVATHEDLKEAVREGRFREDIYYRLTEFVIELPPLREKKEDLQLYAEHFLNMANNELGKTIKGFGADTIAKFQNYNWPGNLREMKNVIKRAALFCQTGLISSSELPGEILNPHLYPSQKDEDEEIADLKSVAEKAEKKAILATLAKTGNNKSKAAELLNVDRKTLYNKMNALGIDP